MGTISTLEAPAHATSISDDDPLGLAARTILPESPEAPPLDSVVDAMRGIAQLDGLTEDEYRWLATHGHHLYFSDGEQVFVSAKPAHSMSILLEGEIHVRRQKAGPVTYFIGRSGQLTGKLAFSRM